jgi:hypothetical protein
VTDPQLRPPIDFSSVRWTHRVVILSGLVALGTMLFLGVSSTQPWVLLVVIIVALLGADGILRGHPSGACRTIADSSPYLFIPVLLPLSASLFFERFVHGYWSIPCGALTGALFGAVIYGEYSSIDPDAPNYTLARFLVNVGAYLTTFALYTVAYAYDLALLPAAVTVGLSSLLVCIEVLREGEDDPVRVIGMGGVIGVLVAETRVALNFLPLGDFLGAVVLLLAFYLLTGLLHSYLVGHFDRATISEFAIVAAGGIAIIIAAQLAGVGE